EIYSPEQYYTIVRAVKKTSTPYKVVEMSQADIYDFKDLARKMKNFTIAETGERVNWLEVNEIAISKDRPYIVDFKYDHTSDVTTQLDLQRKNRRKPNLKTYDLKPLYEGSLRLKKETKNDLMDLVNKGIIPSFYHDAYKNLPVKIVDQYGSTEESDSESD
ncbi:unnamed protein product, partial [Owenia fusiformis]